MVAPDGGAGGDGDSGEGGGPDANGGPGADGGPAPDATDPEPPEDVPAADHTLLRLVHLPAAPDLAAMDVKRCIETQLLGATAVVRVIGSSHYLALPDRSFHELCSCRPLADVGVAVDEAPRPEADGGASADGTTPGDAPGDTPTTVSASRVRRVPLSPGVARAVETVTGDVRARTSVEGLALSAFPADREFDLRYRFGPDAVTAVEVDGDRFETYHTYPEFDLAVRSLTVLALE